MKIRNIWAVYFSPTGNTEKIAEAVARGCAESSGQFEKIRRRDITLPPEREKTLSFCSEDLVVFAMPTYAGRLPNKIMPFVRDRVQGEGALAVPVVTYGNRSADDSLMELNLLLRVNGFRILGGGAFVCQHAFAEVLAAGRPDSEDLTKAGELGRKIAEKAEREQFDDVSFPGHNPVGPYYVPKGTDGKPAVFLKATPKRDQKKCLGCGKCAACCPMGSISAEDFETTGICIKCQACIQNCPSGARYFDDAAFLSHKKMLKENYAETKRRSEIFF